MRRTREIDGDDGQCARAEQTTPARTADYNTTMPEQLANCKLPPRLMDPQRCWTRLNGRQEVLLVRTIILITGHTSSHANMREANFPPTLFIQLQNTWSKILLTYKHNTTIRL